MFHQVPAPFFISGRLMAAYVIPSELMGQPNVGTLHLSATGTDAEGRQGYAYVIESADGTELETGSDLSSGVGSDVDYLATMASLISFLEHSAESPAESSFSPAVAEWAEQNSDALAYARDLIDTNPGNHGDDCSACLAGETAEHLPTYA